MEQLFFNKNFHYVEVVPVNNGVKWSVPQMCQQIATFYKSKNFFGDKIIVWIDREGRQETSDDIRNAISHRLIEEGAPPEQISIMICDRMTENMILADELALRLEMNLPEYTYRGDGCGGKFELKRLYQERGIHYKEMKHGLSLLKKVRLVRAAQNSPQVHHFVTQLGLDCWWLNEGVE